MKDHREMLDEIFVEKLGYEFQGTTLAKPDIEGKDNILSISKEYSARGVDVIQVECKDRIPEFQKKLIKAFKDKFPDSHFLFISNGGNVFDLYNVSRSKKLKNITYNEVDKNTRLFNEKIELFNVDDAEGAVDLKIKIDKAFDISDKVTKNFFDKFEKIHKKLQQAISGIDNEADKSWYASVLMNRLMFIYFLQKHGVLQDDYEFLLTKYAQSEKLGEDFYKDFLLPLFFYGFARRDANPLKQKFTEKYGHVKYLNGGLFYPHHIEKKYSEGGAKDTPYDEIALQTDITVNAGILKEILVFLNGYSWYLDSRPMKEDTDINPDVLGYIFEKYINQKELGAYYTKEDITEYIAKNTILPFIFDKLRRNGFDAPDPNPMITENNIGDKDNNRLLDYIEQLDDYDALKFLFKDILTPLTVLDPSVGSGAFLFAGLNMLLPVYRKTVFKIKTFKETKANDTWLQELCDTLSKHSEEYFLTKQIILNNLYGVDIVEEATEICKLRLFLQLASHLPDIKAIEPLPDIDFNIYAGNSLVGGLSWDDLEKNYTMGVFSYNNRDEVKVKIQTLTDLKTQYRKKQQEDSDEEGLSLLKGQIDFFESEVNKSIDIRVNNAFHWFVDYFDIIDKGGFDVIIGNPPYVEYTSVRSNYEVSGFKTLRSGNLYSYFMERSHNIANEFNYTSFIIPVSVICTDRMEHTQKFILENYNNLWISSYAERPAKLFEGAERNVSILIYNNRTEQVDKQVYSTEYIKWASADRDSLFSNIRYNGIADLVKPPIIPKLGEAIENSIWEKIQSCKKTVENYLVPYRTENVIVYRNSGGRYWKIITDSTPYFTIDGKQQISSREAYLYAKDNLHRDCIIAVLNSTTYYWWYIQNSEFRYKNKQPLTPKKISN